MLSSNVINKIIYTLGLIISIFCAIGIWFLPMYKFDSNKINKYSTEYISTSIDSNIYLYRYQYEFSTLYEESKVDYQNNYYHINKLVYAILNNKTDLYYDLCKFDVLNQIATNYEITGINLSNTSTTDEINKAESTIKNTLGSSFKQVKEEVITSSIDKYYQTIVDNIYESYGVSTIDEYQEIIYQVGVMDITHELLDAYYDCDEELVILIRDEYIKKGYNINTIFNAWNNVKKRNEALEGSAAYVNLSGKELENALATDNEYYQTGPLKLLTTIAVIIFILTLINILYYIFRIKNLQLPKWLIITFKVIFIIQLIIILCLVLGSIIIPKDLLFNYHQVQIARLIQLMYYSKPSVMVYSLLGLSIISVIISNLKNLNNH